MDQRLGLALKSIWHCLSLVRRRQFKLMIGLTILCAFSEMVSLGAVLPFISAITQPEKVMEYSIVSYFAEAMGITTSTELVISLAIAFALAAVISGGLRLCLVWATIQIGNGCSADLNIELYRRTLFQPYAVHISRSSSEIISSITQKISAVAGVLTSVVILITSVFLFITIIITLITIDPFMAFSAATSFGVAYTAIAWSTRHRLKTNSNILAREQNQVVKSLQDGLGSIRDILLDGTQQVYINHYDKTVNKIKLGISQNAFINQFPRYAMESLALVLIAILVLALNKSEGSISEALPVIAVLGLGAQRLLPIIQQIYGNWSVMVGNRAGLFDVVELLEQSLPEKIDMHLREPLVLKKDIILSDIRYRYSINEPWVFDGLNLTIPKGCRVGIIGITGGGKSTLLDLLMGLLSPTSGAIYIDGQENKSEMNRSTWRRSIAHVPQNIYLTDGSIAENIAFGIPPDQINFDYVRKVAEQAQIAEFIENGPQGYQAAVGERGIRLSGGQRQRIGIARALYKNASVIIFDEATSALDAKTERKVMQTIEGLSREITMIIVAHRLTTLQNCSFIIKLERGKIVGQYDYNEIINLEENS